MTATLSGPEATSRTTSRPPTHLEVRGLRTWFPSEHGSVRAVDGVDLNIHRGEVLALVGESGSGKSMTALSIMRLLPPTARTTAEAILLDGLDLATLDERRMNEVRGGRIAMLFQQPKATLDPTSSIGSQVGEALRLHRGVSREEAWRRSVDLLAKVGIPEPARRAHAYRHQMSGGMAQRAMSAAALSAGPELLIADEPTTALDVTVQAQILELLARIRRETQLSMLLITHDLGIVASLADRVAVMYAGRVVEEGPVGRILAAPEHPYTQDLVRSSLLVPDDGGRLFAIVGEPPRPGERIVGCRFRARCRTAEIAGVAERCETVEPALTPVPTEGSVRCWAVEVPGHHGSLGHGGPVRPPSATAGAETGDRVAGARTLMRIEGLSKLFPVRSHDFGRREFVHAVDGVSLDIREGETLGLVGETGCGKSTLARLILRLTKATAGRVIFDGEDVLTAGPDRLKALRRKMQIVFQDPHSALDPLMSIGDSLEAPLAQHGIGHRSGRRTTVVRLLESVGLDRSFVDRRPRECSGGQLQRAVIARALSLSPRFLVCDEPTASLDASIRAQLLNLLVGLRSEFRLTLLLISHDLRVVRYICDRVAVMYLGQIVEVASRREIFARPLHPYTRALLSAAFPDELGGARGGALGGEPPSPIDLPSGCRFASRCPIVTARCRVEPPALLEVEPDHWVSCHRWELGARSVAPAKMDSVYK